MPGRTDGSWAYCGRLKTVSHYVAKVWGVQLQGIKGEGVVELPRTIDNTAAGRFLNWNVELCLRLFLYTLEQTILSKYFNCLQFSVSATGDA